MIARAASCKSNLKQIYTAYRIYSQDYDGLYPAKVECLGSSGFRSPNDSQSMIALLRPYTKNDQIWLCPSAPEEHQTAGVSYMWATAKYGTQNADLEESKNGGGTDQGLLWDNYIYKAPTAIGVSGNPNATANRFSPFNYPHRGGKGLNWLYADGHVKLETK